MITKEEVKPGRCIVLQVDGQTASPYLSVVYCPDEEHRLTRTLIANVPYVYGYAESFAEAMATATKIAAMEDLLAAAKRLNLDCMADVLNPCTLSKKMNQHWGGGEACPACHMKAAIASTEVR